MKFIDFSKCIEGKLDIVSDILDGKIFVYPTDTVYGIGCDAGNCSAVKKVFQIKKRNLKMPLSVIAPFKEWIFDNCVVDSKTSLKIDSYLPGPYTLILKKKKKDFLSVATSFSDTIGVRIPQCSLTEVIQLSNVPFVTTSANFSGEPTAKELCEIPQSFLDMVDFVIEGGVLHGKASTIVDLSSPEFKIKER